MIVKSLFAAALIVGSASMALAQTAPYDGTGDKTMSYGPKAGGAAQTANPSQSPVTIDTVNSYDATGDKTNSYGVRTAH